jgi:diguanylate cyclase (GGDEF)-like protein/PAS domain S-box-containing protein
MEENNSIRNKEPIVHDKLRQFIQNSPSSVAMFDSEVRYIVASKRWIEINSLHDRDFIGISHYVLFPTVPERWRVIHSRCLAGETLRADEDSYVREDGSVQWFSWEIQPWYIVEGEVGGIVMFSEDITERKQGEVALLESEERFRSIIEASPVPYALNNDKQDIIYLNTAFIRTFGYTLEDIPTLDKWWPLAYPDPVYRQWVATRWQDNIDKSMRENVPFETLEINIRCKDGTERTALVGASALGARFEKIHLVVLYDITERRKSEMNLHKNEIALKKAQQLSHVGSWTWYTRTNQLDWSDEMYRIFGINKENFDGNLNSVISRAIHPEDRVKVEKSNNSVITSATPIPLEFRVIKPDGSVRVVWAEAGESIDDDSGNIIALSGIVQDITDRKRVEESLTITASAFGISQEAIVITDAENNIIDVNPAFTRITGYSREDAIGKNPKMLSSGRQSKDFYELMWKSLQSEGTWRGEIWNRRKSGEFYPEMLSISILRDSDGKVLRHVAVFSDISNLKLHEAELVRVAHFDALTSIPNRILLADRMKQAISQTSRDQNMMAICYLDLDGFKPINDALGHEAGDEVLIEIAKRISDTIRGGDTVARLGGDEFVILLLGLVKGDECVSTLERLLAAIAEPIKLNNNTVNISASIGVSIYPIDDEDHDTLLRHADQSMYVAKQSGKNRFHIYDVALDKRARDQNEFLKSIRRALELNQFELLYQPKINLRTKELVGAEALIRWRHPERGLLPPSEFLRYIDKSDLDIAIGEWVTATALAQIDHWRSIGLDIEVSINISGYHMESPRFVEKLQQQLVNYPNLPFGKLQIEVLETVALNDIAIVKGIIESCRKIGVGFALDDFGTGYSSLSYLSGLPVDTLKIDQSFVRDMLEDKGDMAIVQGIIALAKAFERHTVAEGIETDRHFQALLDLGCEIGQGYGIARPMPASEIIKWKSNYS